MNENESNDTINSTKSKDTVPLLSFNSISKDLINSSYDNSDSENENDNESNNDRIRNRIHDILAKHNISNDNKQMHSSSFQHMTQKIHHKKTHITTITSIPLSIDKSKDHYDNEIELNKIRVYVSENDIKRIHTTKVSDNFLNVANDFEYINRKVSDKLEAMKSIDSNTYIVNKLVGYNNKYLSLLPEYNVVSNPKRVISDSNHNKNKYNDKSNQNKSNNIINNTNIDGNVLDMSYKMFGDYYIYTFIQNLSTNGTTYKHLNIRGNRITDSGMPIVINNLQLMDVFLSIDLSENSMKKNSIQELSNYLKLSNNLKKIQLEKLNLTSVLISLLFPITSGPSIRPYSLISLSLSNNKINDKGIHIISNYLSNHLTNLTELDLSWNEIQAYGMINLSKSLVLNKSIKYLDLSWNSIGSSLDKTIHIGKIISNLLVKNKVLLHINLNNNNLSMNDTLIISKGLESNHTLLGIHLLGNQADVNSLGYIVPANDLPINKPINNPTTNKNSVELSTNQSKGYNKIYSDSNCWLCNEWRERRFVYSSNCKYNNIYLLTSFDHWMKTPMTYIDYSNKSNHISNSTGSMSSLYSLRSNDSFYQSNLTKQEKKYIYQHNDSIGNNNINSRLIDSDNDDDDSINEANDSITSSLMGDEEGFEYEVYCMVPPGIHYYGFQFDDKMTIHHDPHQLHVSTNQLIDMGLNLSNEYNISKCLNKVTVEPLSADEKLLGHRAQFANHYVSPRNKRPGQKRKTTWSANDSLFQSNLSDRSNYISDCFHRDINLCTYRTKYSDSSSSANAFDRETNVNNNNYKAHIMKNVDTVLCDHYEIIMDCFHYFASQSNELFSINKVMFQLFVKSTNLLATVIDQSDNQVLYRDRYEEVKIVNKLDTVVTSHQVDDIFNKNTITGPWHKDNDKRSLCLFQFMDALVELADIKYLQTNSALDLSEAVRRVIRDHISEYTNHTNDKRYFYKSILLTEKVDEALRQNLHYFNQLFESHSNRNKGDAAEMSYREFIYVCIALELPDNIIDDNDCKLAFARSVQLPVEIFDTKNRQPYKLSFFDFLEAITRLLYTICKTTRSINTSYQLTSNSDDISVNSNPSTIIQPRRLSILDAHNYTDSELNNKLRMYIDSYNIADYEIAHYINKLVK